MYPKQKGTNFEYRVKYALKDLGYYVIRSYASLGTADLVAIPPKTAKDPRGLLIQCKNTKKGGYIDPIERARLTALSQKSAGKVLVIFNYNHRMMVTNWETREEFTFVDYFK